MSAATDSGAMLSQDSSGTDDREQISKDVMASGAVAIPELNSAEATNASIDTANNSASTSQPSSPQFKPTVEQLSQWKIAEFEPLRMVAYRDHKDIGVVGFIAAVNESKEYLLGGTRLTLWSMNDSSKVHEFLGAKTADNERLLCFAVSPDATWCVVGDAGGLLRKFDIPGHRELVTKQTEDSDIVRLAISPDGKEIATSSYTSEVAVWDAETLERKSTFKVDSRDLNHLQYTASGQLIVAGESMSTWDSVTGKKLTSYPSQKYQSAIAQSPDGKHLLFGANEFLQRWSLIDDKANGEIYGVPFRSAAIRFTGDGKLVAIVTTQSIQIVDAGSGRQLQFIEASGSDVTDAYWLPDSHVLMVSTDWGRNRIWGRPDECKKLGVEPATYTAIDSSVNGNEPASTAQNLLVMDLRTLPVLPDAKSQTTSFASLNYSTAFSLSDATDFYRFVLGSRGWQEDVAASSANSLLFAKDGYELQLSPYSASPGQTYINVTFLGNHDLTQLPRYSTVKETLYAGPTSVIYKVAASIFKVETELLRKFHAEGWTNVIRLNSRQSDDTNSRHLEFLKNGTLVRVMVQRDEADASLLNVHYSQSLSGHALPVPKDAGVMEWDDYAECQMVANSQMSLKELTAFYESEMPMQGWIKTDRGRKVEKDLVYLPYYKDQHDLTIALNTLDGGLVRIRTGNYSDNSFQKPDDEKSTDEAPSTTTDTPANDLPGIEAADFPILHANGPAEFDAAIGSIRVVLDKTSLIEISGEYEAAMKELGWEVKPFGEPTKESVNLHFEKDSETIYFQASIDPLGNSLLRLSGEGLKWTKPITSVGPISYAAWLSNQKLPASLNYLDKYEVEMSKLNKE